MPDYPFNAQFAENALSLIRQGYAPSQFCGPHASMSMSFSSAPDYTPVPGIPAARTTGLPADPAVIEEWAVTNEAFGVQYAAAKRVGADSMVAFCLSIADNPLTKADQKKVQIDTRMKIAALWYPEKYGAKAEKEPPNSIQAMVHMPYADLPAEKRAAVDKFFGTEDD